MRLNGEMDLAIVDLVMPGVSGVDLVVRPRQAEPNAKILIASSYGVEGKVRDVAETGALAHFAKPFEVSDLWEWFDRSLASASVAGASGMRAVTAPLSRAE